MGKQALLAAVLCWFTLSEIGKADKIVNSSVVKDIISAESVPRLYRNVPLGVYASAVPYASFRVPVYIPGPKVSASRVVPVKEQIAYLKDSYGNRFVETPQSVGYRATIPQQYVQLQQLPAHLAQPLAVASPTFQFKQVTSPVVWGSQYRVPTLQGAVPTSISNFAGLSQPLVYAQNVRSLAPSTTVHFDAQRALAPQQQSTNNKAQYTNTQSVQKYNTYGNEPKFQRLEESPNSGKVTVEQIPEHNKKSGHNDKAQLTTSSDTKTYTRIVNGEKTVIQLDTKPPVPLLDLTLLEPLTFDNPLVPQVQHFLPRINQATYQKLPDFKIQQHKKIANENRNDSESSKVKAQKAKPKRKQKKPIQYDDTNHENTPEEPTITFRGTPNESPEITYEINSPNYKETYKEQTLSYNTETTMKPVNYAYEHKAEKEPVNYSYGNIVQKEPIHYTYVHETIDTRPSKEPEYRGKDEPRHLIYTFKPEEQKEEKLDKPRPESEGPDSAEESIDERHTGQPQKNEYHNHHKQHDEATRHTEHPRSKHVNSFIQYKQIPNQEVPHHVQIISQRPPQQYSQSDSVNYQPELYPTTQEYEEDIRLISPTHEPHAAIQVDPTQHLQKPASQQYPHPSPIPHSNQNEYAPQQHQHKNFESSHNPPHIHEKSKRIIIKEETPEEMHSHREQMRAEMVQQEENNEEDFEKAYKNAAFGFPAYHKSSEDIEKDIYNPDSYGIPRYHEYEIDHAAFKDYQADGDQFPKSARLTYKDARDNTKDDYYLDYAVHKPESLVDRYKNKQNYYKLYESYKPEKYFSDEKKQNEKERYTVAPSFVYNSEPQKKKNYFAQYKAAPQKYEYRYPKGTPHDNSAFASRPNQRLTSRTHFVEPQFQYGFEPIALPRLLDSELAAMASNDSPESEKPGMRKKIYKENWYIKKTSTVGGDAS